MYFGSVMHQGLVGELFDKLSSIEGAASNLRGALFEMLVGHCVQKCEDGLIDIGKRLVDKATGKEADVDVFRVKEHREVWCYECKGHQPTEIVGLLAVQHWLTDRVPVTHGALKSEERFQGCEFQSPPALNSSNRASGRRELAPAQASEPSPAKPMSVIAQVEGSGAATKLIDT
jgi:hypothetical protein